MKNPLAHEPARHPWSSGVLASATLAWALASCAALVPTARRESAPSPVPASGPAFGTALEPASAARAAAARQEGETSGGPSKEDLAKQLSNPIASLISVPLQLNYDQDIGPADGERLLLNVQPVVPLSLNEEWNLISRTIVPLIRTDDVPPGEDETGIGDTVQSLFLSPVAPTASGWIWGAGPVFLLPTASDRNLGRDQFGIGPTGVALKQSGPWTYGGLANHIWGDGDGGAEVDATFVQPFVTYTTPDAWTYAVNFEATYDWEIDDLALPVNVAASKVLTMGGQLVQVGVGLRYWLEDTVASPEGWALRFNFVLLFPK